ncbi:MAG: hypothetical protein WC777_01750 [Candidatus Gracilibacteria bacterium]|jgi:hypothetical protein
MDEGPSGPLMPSDLVEHLDAKGLADLAKGEGAQLPANWNAFPIQAKRAAVGMLLNGNLTPDGFQILEPDFLNQIDRLRAPAEAIFEASYAVLKANKGPEN